MDLIAVRAFAEGVLRSYSQLLFSRSLLVGGLLLAATAMTLSTLLLGLGAVIVALATSRALGYSPDAARDGIYGYNALLIGVGGGALLEPSAGSVLVVLAAAAISVPVTAAFHAALGQAFGLPSLTLPFLAVFAAVLAATPAFGLAVGTTEPFASPELPAALDAMLQSIGAIFFLPRAGAGALILLALVVSSRIAVVLAALAFAVVYGFASLALPGGVPVIALGLNAVFTAFALGGIWFVPSAASFALAIGGAIVSSGIVIALSPVAARLGVPLLILPFNLTVLLFLYALRQRMSDGRPKSVDFIIGTPEENLAYYRTRLARFGARYTARFSAPFLGAWTCTQGNDGEWTHRGPWRHGFDFEVLDAEGRKHRRDGTRLEHYFCYRLPIVAAADGVVVRAVDGLPDNVPGRQNLEQNWGNLVVVRHGLGLHSLVCHLAPGSIAVREGQTVRRGDLLGRCGASGRAPEPHLHFQLQASARVGAPTIPGELHDVMLARAGEDARLLGTATPDLGDVVRNLEAVADLAKRFELVPGKALAFELDAGGGPRREEITPEVDLAGELVLRSREAGASLFFHVDDRMLTVFDAVGARRSVLHVLRIALSRVPFEAKEGFEWSDYVPLRAVVPPPLSVLLDFVSPFVRAAQLEIRFSAHARGDEWVIRGRSTRTGRDGRPLLETEAVIGARRGIERASVTRRGRTTSFTRRELERPEVRAGAPAGAPSEAPT